MSSDHAASAPNQSTIVVVDDEPVLLSMMEDIISELGYTPQPFSGAAEALAFITESRNEVRLLLTDFCMPGSMSGGELALNVVARFPDLPVIVTSGFLDSAFQMGPEVAFIAKPWSFDTMAALVEKLTGGPKI